MSCSCLALYDYDFLCLFCGSTVFLSRLKDCLGTHPSITTVLDGVVERRGPLALDFYRVFTAFNQLQLLNLSTTPSAPCYSIQIQIQILNLNLIHRIKLRCSRSPFTRLRRRRPRTGTCPSAS